MTLALKMADIQYDAYEEGWEKGHEDGLAIGLEQGAYNKTVEVAQKLLAMGLSLEQIEQVTELPHETILQLQDSSSS